MLFSPLFGYHGFKCLAEQLLIAFGSGLDDIDKKISARHKNLPALGESQGYL